MGLTNVAMQMARSALEAQRTALEISGNNIANANNETYARRRVQMVSNPDIRLGSGIMMGTGVSVQSTQRVVDTFLEERIRDANADSSSLLEQRATLSRIEGIYQELGDSDLSSMMNQFFAAVSDLANHPDQAAQRQLVVSVGENLTEQIRLLRRQIDEARSNINLQFDAAVQNVNALAGQVADLNTQIVAKEAAGAAVGSAAALRDQRDQCLRDLSDLITIDVVEQNSGSVEVLAGSRALVSGGEVYTLHTESAMGYDRATGEWIDDPSALGADALYQLPVKYAVFDGDGSELRTEGGRIHGYLVARDELLVTQADALDALASNLAFEVNKVHSEGVGLSTFDSVRSADAVDDADAVLNDAGLSWAPVNGSFDIRVHDLSTGLSRSVNIQVDLDGVGSDETLNSLAAKINTEMTNAGLDVSATVNANGSLTIASGSRDTGFSFADDTSNVLAVMGINTFFTGHDARTIGVNPVVLNDFNRVAVGLTGAPNDGTNASRIFALRKETVDALGGRTIEEFYRGTISAVAIEASITNSRHDGAEAFKSSLLSERESISGVNLDEEAMNLMRYQRAFQAAAKLITVVDEMIQTLLELV